MISWHSIENAEFDTRFSAAAASPARQQEIERFIQAELIAVIDKVFDEVERNAGKLPLALSLERLELDLGTFSYADHRQQMPRRLRRELMRVLENARYDPAAQRRPQTEDTGLYQFLRHGYLAGRGSPVVDLEDLLRRALAARPERLRRFLLRTARREDVLQRLAAQFPPNLVERVHSLLRKLGVEVDESTAAESPETGAEPDYGRILQAFEVGDFESLWQTDSKQLETRLRELGQRVENRRALARRLPRARFAELIRLLEPAAGDDLTALLDRWPRIADAENDEDSLREYLLGYLLVERGAGFDADEFAYSLLNQVAASPASRQPGFWPGLADRLGASLRGDEKGGNLLRALLARVEARRPDDDIASALAADYGRYARLAASFRTDVARTATANLLVDLDALQQRSPWLLLRLLRELQSHTGWQRALPEIPAPVLEQLTYSLLSIMGQTVAAETSAGSRELVAAIRQHVVDAPDAQGYFSDILRCVIRGDLIDFEALGSDDKPATEAVARRETLTTIDAEWDLSSISALGPQAARMLQTAELLSTAGQVAAPELPPRRLQSIKKRFVEAYLRKTGNLFNQVFFVRDYLAELATVAAPRDLRAFYSSLGQALLQNSLPSTRDLARRLIEQLDESARDLEPAGATPVSETPADGDIADEAPADEMIQVTNAGLVLLAPWLPRLFAQLGYLEDGSFVDRETAERAVHCLQFLVDGSTDNPEHLLVLNKILCGVRPGKPIRREIGLNNAEIDALEGLLVAITQHWKALTNTSIDGLRESFLQRGGRLERRDDAWRLAVEARSFDMLLDQLPWSFSVIRFGWMERVIYVDWR